MSLNIEVLLLLKAVETIQITVKSHKDNRNERNKKKLKFFLEKILMNLTNFIR